MKKSLFSIVLLFALTACFNKEKAAEEETTPAPAAENPAAINLNDQTQGGSLNMNKLPKQNAKQLGVPEDYPVMVLPRNAFGVQQIINMMSVKGRADLPLPAESKKVLSKKKQFFVVLADNQNHQAAINMLTVALQNCQADSNAVVGILIDANTQPPEQLADLQKKCNVQVLPQQAQ